MKRTLSFLIIGLLAFPAILSVAEGMKEKSSAPRQEYPWKPVKPVTLIVPWGTGGSTDRSARVTAGILEGYLGTKIVIVNQVGDSGAVGTKSAMEAARDGYTWTTGAVKDLGTYKVKGQLDTVLDDWHIYLNVAQPQVVSVSSISPYKTFADLLSALKSKGSQITVATAGVNSVGHTAIEMMKKFGGFRYRHVAYDGGNSAVIAVVNGEAEVTTQLSSEQVDMIRAGRLRPLAVLAGSPLMIRGVPEPVPPITQWLSDFRTAPTYFGIFVPEGVPQEVLTTLNMIWDRHMKDSEILKTFARENAVISDPAYGEEGLAKAYPMVRLDAWLAADAGTAVVDPETLGIHRPE